MLLCFWNLIVESEEVDCLVHLFSETVHDYIDYYSVIFGFWQFASQISVKLEYKDLVLPYIESNWNIYIENTHGKREFKNN